MSVPRGRTLRVGLVYDDSLDQLGGVTQYVRCLARALGRRGHLVSILAGASSASHVDGTPVTNLSRNIRIPFNGSVHTMPLLSTARRIRAATRDSKFDVVHVQVPYSPIMAGRVIARLHADTALVGTFHVASDRMGPRIGARALSAVTHRSLRRFDAFMSVSGCAAGFAHDTYGIRHSAIVPNMIEPAHPDWRPSASSHDSKAVSVAFLGALVPRKGPDRLLAGFRVLLDACPGATLAIAGEGPMRGRLERQALSLSLGTAVRFLGIVSEPEKTRILAAADIACFPSRFGESFGVVLLEAIAAGSGVVVAGRNAGYHELFAASPLSLCETDPLLLGERLVEFAHSPRLRETVRRQQVALLSRYDADVVAGEILRVYHEALRVRRPSWRAAELDAPLNEAQCAA